LRNDPSSSLYLCLDQGGHASRAIVFDEHGRVTARSVHEVSTRFPAADCVEQDPDEVANSVIRAADDAMAALGSQAVNVRAAGLATQRSSIVCWDRRTGDALSPVLSWQDRRAHVWLQQFSSRGDEIAHLTGLRLSAHYGASKLRWCLDHVDAVGAAARQGHLAFGPLASFLLFRLLDERPIVVDPSNAQRTLLWNIASRNWDSSLLELFGIPIDALPVNVPTRHHFGTLSLAGRSVPLTVATGDQAAALYAFGVPMSDTAYVNMGTGAFIQRPLSDRQHAEGLLTGVAIHDRDVTLYTWEGTVNGAGAALAWAAQHLDLPELEVSLPEWLGREMTDVYFLNGIGGLGAPFWIPDFRSRFVGDAPAWQKAVAVAESVVFLLVENLTRMQRDAPPRLLIATGGLSKLDGLCQRLADLAGIPVSRPDDSEATARGLAVLLRSLPVAAQPSMAATFVPMSNAALARRYLQWRDAMAHICAGRS
jgi:glycerol kinase